MRIQFGCGVALSLFVFSPPLDAAEPFARTGSAKIAAYTVCRALSEIDMEKVGSNSSSDCVGIVKNREGGKTFDNLSIRCLEESTARTDGYKFNGTCVETDADGDKIFMTYEGPESGPLSLIGGTGKYAGVEGSGTWSVTDAPGNTPAQFLFTLNCDVNWRFK